MADVYCLFCNRKLTTRSNDISASRCGKCGSSDLVLVNTVNSITNEVSQYMDKHMLPTMSYLDIMTTVIQRHGFTLRPRSTLRLCSLVYNLLEKKWKSDMQKDLSVSTDRDRAL